MRRSLATLTLAVLVMGTACSSGKAASSGSTAPSSASGLGAFASAADLTQAIRTAIASRAASRDGVHLCRVVSYLVYANTAVLNGAPVVVEVSGAPGQQQIGVYNAST